MKNRRITVTLTEAQWNMLLNAVEYTREFGPDGDWSHVPQSQWKTLARAVESAERAMLGGQR